MIEFNRAACIGCGACVRDCFPHALSMEDGAPALSAPASCIRCGHCIAVCPTGAVTMPDADMAEVVEGIGRLGADELLHAMQSRRSVRQYTDEPVTDEELNKLLDAARWCPTAKNAQDTKYIIVREKKDELLGLALKDLASLGRKSLAFPGFTKDDARRAENFIRWYDEYQADPVNTDPLFFHAPALILFISGKEMRDAAAAAAYTGLMADALGLGCLFSGYLNAVTNTKAIRELLGLEEGERVARCLVVGHPAVRFRRSVPRDHADVRYR